MGHRDIIVVGASAGGVGALTRLVRSLPRDLPATLLVVLHIGSRNSSLPEILASAGLLPAGFAEDGAPLLYGRILVARPDHHLHLGPEGVRLSRGPRENGTRPAVDPLFRSAARTYGPRVIGVILSGTLGDGTAGLAEIKHHGGATVVQDPEDADYPGMPLSALRNTTVDYRIPVTGMADLLVRLTALPHRPGARPQPGTPIARLRKDDGDLPMEGYDLTAPVALTCPHCGGALAETTVDSLRYFTCHIGHRFAAPDMEEAQFRKLEESLEIALRSLNERAALCRRLAETARKKGHSHSAAHWERAMQEVEERAAMLAGFIQQGWRRPDPGGDEDPAS